eukprot:scaffold2727_cov275-Chaetoceros_neogracile.AAC.4
MTSYGYLGYPNPGDRSNYTPPTEKQQPGIIYQRYDPSSPAPMYMDMDSSSSSSIFDRCCSHLKDFIVLFMVAAFLIFSGYICYYLISNYG